MPTGREEGDINMSDGEIPKVMRDGKVAVNVSSNYGGGYATEGSLADMFSPEMVMRIERRSRI